ncbi:glutathione S-transferase family protein [Simiduia sp. 21SJ11W-1]|uniref:glutathione S-transferase family protein n=1 Tax=Simiduia sp. 21SJ11W-1 TaxID=2909669 RepID=UPI00209DB547|nr:glutathione S-transferase family protein [Simiduia sp. 21SJ11W-1]UTA47760.1 glutathione S-transferase family protein [Simiduia sp. 21SJ11W-1]
MKLYGSNTSPYVRRLRIWLAERDYEYINMNIFAGEDRKLLKAKNPTLKIPMIEDDGRIIFDSNTIYRYLTEKYATPALNWDQENQLTLVNAASDSLIQLLLCERSNLDTHSDVMFFKLQRERLAGLFGELDKQVAKGQFDEWNYATIGLYCLIDWVEFRALHEMQSFGALLEFHNHHAATPLVQATDPRD